MIDDHTKVGDRLQTIASREGFTLPKELTPEQQAAHDRLSALSGAEFDKAYREQLKQDHQEAISVFQNEAQNGTDPQFQSFAQSTLPSLRHHQQMASRPTKTM